MQKQTILIALALVLALSSCSRSYYIPNVQNVPLFIEKDEFHATIASGGGSDISVIEVQAAYSITNILALMTSFMSGQGGDRSSNNWGKGNYLEGAVGYYRPYNGILVAGVFAGYGASNQHHQFGANYSDGTADLSFAKYFLQPSFGLTYRAFDIALSTRISRLSFYNIDTNLSIGSVAMEDLDAIAHNKVSYLFEPALTIRGGWKYIKVQMQLSSSKNLSHSDLQFEDINASLGLYFVIAKRYSRVAPNN
ncbi:MAG: hypothetical protein PHS05_01580 [Bacteroidales bacterium]|jgi:hypothetical protein|nr:hypothetical protein [Bacteroidales bacterium]MDY0197722.1 hypothetical protein [Tenuifilaceae bacterium]